MKKTFLLLAIAALGFAGIANATLINRGADSLGNRLIYDDDLNITWYDYTRYAQLLSANTWQSQMDWATNLSVTFGGETFDDWRLPATVNSNASTGYNKITSEMGHLYYTELGNVYGIGIQNAGPFQHLVSSQYWSSTESSLNPGYAWVFSTANGYQYDRPESYYRAAMAVRDGDVAAVPEPGTWMLLGSGLVGLAAFRRKLARR